MKLNSIVFFKDVILLHLKLLKGFSEVERCIPPLMFTVFAFVSYLLKMYYSHIIILKVTNIKSNSFKLVCPTFYTRLQSKDC